MDAITRTQSPRAVWRSRSNNGTLQLRHPAAALPDNQPLIPNSGRGPPFACSKHRLTSSDGAVVALARRSKESREASTFTQAASENGCKGRVARCGSATSPVGSSGPNPSAWALSPGRSPPRAETAEAGGSGGKKKGGEGVMGMFQQKKSASVEEEAMHEVRMLSCRYAQWRLVNARAEAAMDATTLTAERKLFSLWGRLRRLRKLMVAKKKVVERAKHSMKLRDILIPQIKLLMQWEKNNDRTLNSVTKSANLLQSLCVHVPLANGAQGEVAALKEALCEATSVMEEVEHTFAKFYGSTDRTSKVLNNLVETLQQEMEGLEQLMCIIKTIAALEMQESSLRANFLQVAMGTSDSVISSQIAENIDPARVFITIEKLYIGQDIWYEEYGRLFHRKLVEYASA